MQGLTRRQREIARLVASGMTSRQIGRKLGISPRTVEAHRAAIARRPAQKSRIAPLDHPVVQRAFRRLSSRVADLAREVAALRELSSAARGRREKHAGHLRA